MKLKISLLSKILTLSALPLLFGYTAIAQEGDTTAVVEEEKPAKDKRPIKDPFASGYLINNQTIVIPTAKTLEYIIQHRFGKLNSGIFDLAGLYAPSNIRMGLNFSITDRVLVGIGTTKNNKLQDVNWKFAILRQTRSGNIPVGIVYFGIVALDARSDIFPKLTNRLSYFHQFPFHVLK